MKQISNAELKIMNLLWSEGKSFSSRELLERLNGEEKHPWKLTTLSTLLTRLSDKGVVSIRRDGSSRGYRYQAKLSREEYAAQNVRNLFSVAGNSYKNLVLNLIEQPNGLSVQELEELSEYLDKKRQELKGE